MKSPCLIKERKISLIQRLINNQLGCNGVKDIYGIPDVRLLGSYFHWFSFPRDTVVSGHSTELD